MFMKSILLRLRIVLMLVCTFIAVLYCVFSIPTVSLVELRAQSTSGTLLRLPAGQVHIIDEGNANGSPILLVHGFASSTYSWRKVRDVLRQSHRVISVDLWGFGETDRPEDLSLYSLDAQSLLLVDVIRALSISDVHVVGHSYGAHVAMRAVEMSPELFEAVTLVSGGFPRAPQAQSTLATSPALRWLLLPVAHTLVGHPYIWEKIFQESFYKDTVQENGLSEEYRKRLFVEGLEYPLHGTIVHANELDRQPHIPLSLPAPCVIWGAHDGLIPLADGRLLSSTLKAEFFVLSDVGHMPMEESPIPLSAHIQDCDMRQRKK
jgi:pimeloyl-ACP methyl ester carboxylesterase